MNYEDVDSKISIIDNGTNNSIGYMPLWNINKLHLVIDTDNSTSTTFENNFFRDPVGKSYCYGVNFFSCLINKGKNEIQCTLQGPEMTFESMGVHLTPPCVK